MNHIYSLVPGRFFILLILLPGFLFACSSTQLIEETPTELIDVAEADDEAEADQPDDEAASDHQGVAQAYPEDVAGTVSELYGEQAESRLSDSYRQAVDTNPSLRYNVVYFDYDDYTNVRAQGRQLIREHALYLQANPRVKVSVEGHTDERGSGEYNIALGERRANTVRNLLLAYGAPADSLSTISYGEERPALQGSTERAYSKNRRVEIIYY